MKRYYVHLLCSKAICSNSNMNDNTDDENIPIIAKNLTAFSGAKP